MKDRKEHVKELANIVSDSAEEYMRQAYDLGYKDASEKHDADGNYKDGYADGLMHAWNCAKELYQMWHFQRGEVFNLSDIEMNEVFQMEPLNAVKALNDYKEKYKVGAEIKVGDEVYYLDKNYKCVVTAFYNAVDAIMIAQSGKWTCVPTSKLHKTGRHYPQIEEVLKGLKGE